MTQIYRLQYKRWRRLSRIAHSANRYGLITPAIWEAIKENDECDQDIVTFIEKGGE